MRIPYFFIFLTNALKKYINTPKQKLDFMYLNLFYNVYISLFCIFTVFNSNLGKDFCFELKELIFCIFIANA